MSSNEQKMICNKNDGAPEQQDDKQPFSINSSNNDAIGAVAEGIESITLLDKSTDVSEVSKEKCAACGKEGNSRDMNTCNKCKSVKYCNAACKKKHKSKHKKACDRRVAELHDEQLFKEVEREEECPICMLPLPLDGSVVFKTCCGKSVCSGCMFAMVMNEGGVDLCAFCRTPRASNDEEHIKRTKNLMDKGNAVAFYHLAGAYDQGLYGIRRNRAKANELLLKAGELGCARGYYNLGYFYDTGITGGQVDKNKKKAKQYYELSAMMGHLRARHNLGCIEGQAGNHNRARRYFLIAARAGYEDSLDIVKAAFMEGVVTKDEYAHTLRAFHERQQEMKSSARDEAKAMVAEYKALKL